MLEDTAVMWDVPITCRPNFFYTYPQLRSSCHEAESKYCMHRIRPEWHGKSNRGHTPWEYQHDSWHGLLFVWHLHMRLYCRILGMPGSKIETEDIYHDSQVPNFYSWQFRIQLSSLTYSPDWPRRVLMQAPTFREAGHVTHTYMVTRGAF